MRIDRARVEIHIVAECVRNHFRLFVDFLFHEMAMVALVDHEGCSLRNDPWSVHFVAIVVEDLCTVRCQDRPVAIDEIGDFIGERRQRDGI